MQKFLTTLLSYLFYPPVLVFIFLIPTHLLFFANLTTLNLAKNFNFDLNLFYFSILCTVVFFLVFMVFSTTFRPRSTRILVFDLFPKRVYGISFFLLSVSIIALFSSVRFSSLERIFQSLVFSNVDINLRDDILFDRPNSGIFSAMTFFSISNLFFLLSIAFFNPIFLKKIKFILFLFSTLLVIFVRGVIFLDRMSIVGVIIAILCFLFLNKKIQSFLLKNVLIGLVFLIGVQSLLRGGYLLSDNPFFLYSDLCMANSALSFQNQTDFSLGLASLFHFLTFPARFFGININNMTELDYIWNPASCFLSYSINDFGNFGFISFIVLGAISGFFYAKRFSSPVFYAFYLWMTFGVFSIFTVPFFRGPEYWYGLTATALASFLVSNPNFDIFLIFKRNLESKKLFRYYK